jgi:hypothetical protein
MTFDLTNPSSMAWIDLKNWLRRATGIGWPKLPPAKRDPRRVHLMVRAVNAAKSSERLEREFLKNLEDTIRE